MQEIQRECRRESFMNTPVSQRKRMILDTIGNREMTARDVARKLNFSDLNAVKPRITELCNAGLLEACGKAHDYITDRTVSVYRRVSR